MRLFSSYFDKPQVGKILRGEKKKKKKMHTAQNIIRKDRIALLGFNQ
jgi:hypothetical protein